MVLIGCGSEQADHKHSDYNAVNHEKIKIYLQNLNQIVDPFN